MEDLLAPRPYVEVQQLFDEDLPGRQLLLEVE